MIAPGELAARLLDSLSTGVLLIDGSQRLRSMNAAAEQLLGLSQRQAQGAAFEEVVPRAAALTDMLRRAIASGRSFSHHQLELPPRHLPGRDITLECSFTPLERGDQETPWVIVELRDAGMRLRLDREAALLVQLEASRSMLRQLAHEIKNPLGGLRGAAQLLERRLDSEDLRNYTTVILREADRLAGLVDRMLGPRTAPDRRGTNIHELLEHVHQLVSAEALGEVTVTEDYDPSLPPVHIDRDETVQVLLNLARNAIEAVGARGRVQLRTRAQSQVAIGARQHALAVRVDVEDDGPGVPDSVRDTLFYPLVSGRRGGTGLGLALAQALAQRQGGTIEYSSEAGRTVFSLLLPVEKAP